MFTFIIILIVITCVLLGLVVLVQNSKGGGLASNLAASTQIMGVRKTSDFLEKLTWGLAITLIFLSLVTVFTIPRGGEKQNSTMQEQIDNSAAPAPAPAAPSTPPPAPPQQ